MSMTLEEMSGVTPRIAGLLEEAGITTIMQLAEADLESLMSVRGIGPKTAEALLATASATLEELNRMIEESVAEELAEAEEKPLFDESIFGPDEEGAEVSEVEEVVPETPDEVVIEGDPFKDFDTVVDPEATESEEPEKAEKGVDPFADTELQD
jgi:5'-3' exonuclease